MLDRLAEWGRRIWYLINRRRFEDALRREMESHRERLGEPARFGNTLRLREEARDAWGWHWLDASIRDIRLSARTLRRSPAFSLAAVLILAFGIGINLAFFQLVNAALLRPIAVKDPATLVRFDRRGPTFSSTGVSAPLARLVESHTTVLSRVLLRQRVKSLAWGPDSSARASAAFVSAAWFDELGAVPAKGRFFETRDDAPGSPTVVVVSHAFWVRQLGRRPDIVGATLHVNGQAATVIGVAGADFPDVDLDAVAMWLPLSQTAFFFQGSTMLEDWNNDVEMYGRLAPGVAIEAATACLRTLLERLRAENPEHIQAGEWLDPHSGLERFLTSREARQVRLAASGAAGIAWLVLTIACLNLSNLTLARTTARIREMTIRVSLGAGRAQVVRHLLIESGVLAVAGALAGLALEQFVLRTLAGTTSTFARTAVQPDWRTGLALVGISCVTMLMVGLLPAWKVARVDLAPATRDGGERMSQGLHGTRLRYVLVAGQIGGSCLLLVLTTQLMRSVQQALADDLGFEFAQVAVFQPSLNAHGFSPAAARRYWIDFRDRLAAYPGVVATALTSEPPLSGGGSASRFRSAQSLRITNLRVEPAFFDVMEVPILAGRRFGPGDDPARTVIISRRVALVMYGTTNVVGQYFPKDTTQGLIIGVAGDAHLMNVRATDAAEQYWPVAAESADASFVVRTSGDPAALIRPLRDIARTIDPRVLPDTRLLRDDFQESLRVPRTMSLVATAVGVAAFGLAFLGIVGVVAHGAGLRTKEIGIRLALGARPSSVVRMLLRHTALACGVGLVFGIGAAVALRPLLALPPFFLPSSDPAVHVIVASLFTVMGGVAAIVPVRRTLRADPLKALRQE